VQNWHLRLFQWKGIKSNFYIFFVCKENLRSALLGGWIAKVYGFGVLFQLMFLISLVGLVVSFLLMKRVKKR